MKKVFLIGLLLCALYSCGKKNKTPKGLYSKATMASFIKDVYLLEAKIDNMGLPYDSAKKVFTIYEEGLRNKHQIDDSVYRLSFNYYLTRTKDMSQIYNMVTDSLGIEERLINEKTEKKD